jgi:hypothetical protein
VVGRPAPIAVKEPAGQGHESRELLKR